MLFDTFRSYCNCCWKAWRGNLAGARTHLEEKLYCWWFRIPGSVDIRRISSFEGFMCIYIYIHTYLYTHIHTHTYTCQCILYVYIDMSAGAGLLPSTGWCRFRDCGLARYDDIMSAGGEVSFFPKSNADFSQPISTYQERCDHDTVQHPQRTEDD